MPKQVKHIASLMECKRVYAHMRPVVLADKKLRKIWCVVEADEDKKVYKKLLHSRVHIEVASIASDAEPYKETHGCEAVEQVVADLLAMNEAAYIFGIRDTDYTRFTTTYQQSPNVFLTDGRDLEMMLLKSQDVKNAINVLATRVPDALNKACTISREIGYVRIFNDCHPELGYRVNDIHKCDQLWNQGTKNYCTGWKDYVWDAYEQHGAYRIAKADVAKFVQQKQLNAKANEDICQGHDTIGLFIHICNSGAADFEEQVKKAWYGHYPMADFLQTSLFGDILSWANRKEIEVF